MQDRIVKLEEKLSSRPAAADLATGNVSAIPLHDLSNDAAVEVRRLEARLASLTEELSQQHSRYQQLAAANHRLDAELRDAKLLLSKVQMSELRIFEKSFSWLRR